MDEPRITIAASPREWVQRLHRYAADHGGVQVRATVLHPDDALLEDYDVFVADDTTSFLTRRLVDELHRQGRAVLGVHDPDDPRGKGELIEVGADEVIERGATAETFVATLAALAARNRQPVEGELDALVRDLLDQPDPGAEPGATGAGSAARTTATVPPPPRGTPALRRGQVTAVAAACGGAGASEIAIGLAATCGRRGDSTVLVDADDVAPALAQRLDVSLYPNVRAAVDALARRSARLASLCQPVPAGRFSLLAGLSNPTDWSQLRAGEVTDVLGVLAEARRHVLVNVGHRIEDLHSAGGPPRYGLARQVLAAADALVAVALATPVGVAALLAWLADARVLAPDTPVHVVFNRAPASSFHQAEVAAELGRSFVPASLWFVPHDPRVEAAAWAGELTIKGPFARAVAAAAAGVLPTEARVPARGRRSGAGR